LTRSRLAKVALACVGLVAIALGSVRCGQIAGKERGIATLARIQLVWPDVLIFPHDERLFLAELALECRVTAEPAAAAIVLSCLYRAAEARETEGGEKTARSDLRKLVRKEAPAR